MAPLRIFDIPFIGLADGDHSYDYTLNGAFFEEFGNEELKESSFKVDVVLSKKPTFMELTMHFSGSCTVPCDRCDAPLEILMDGDSFLVVRFGEGPDQDEELMYIPRTGGLVRRPSGQTFLGWWSGGGGSLFYWFRAWWREGRRQVDILFLFFLSGTKSRHRAFDKVRAHEG